MATRRTFSSPVGRRHQLRDFSVSSIGNSLGAITEVGSVTFFHDGALASPHLVRAVRWAEDGYLVEVLCDGRMRLAGVRSVSDTDADTTLFYPLPAEAAAVLPRAAIPACAVLGLHPATSVVFEWLANGELHSEWQLL